MCRHYDAPPTTPTTLPNKLFCAQTILSASQFFSLPLTVHVRREQAMTTYEKLTLALALIDLTVNVLHLCVARAKKPPHTNDADGQ